MWPQTAVRTRVQFHSTTRVRTDVPYILQTAALWIRVTARDQVRHTYKMYRNCAKQKYNEHFPYTIQIHYINYTHPSRRLRLLRRRSAAALLLELRVRIPPVGHVYLSLVNVLCRQVEVFFTGRSLVQRSPTECDVYDQTQ
jgi:putative hemolysin